MKKKMLCHRPEHDCPMEDSNNYCESEFWCMYQEILGE